MAQEIYLLQEDKVVRPVTDPEWTRQEGDNDCDLEPSGPNHSTIRVVRRCVVVGQGGAGCLPGHASGNLEAGRQLGS